MANQAQEEFLRSIGALDAPQPQPIPASIPAPTTQEPSTERARTFAQGLTFGFGEEIEAIVRSMVPEALGGEGYEAIRDDLRKRLADYKETHPDEALTLELAGALAPAAVMIASGFGAGGAAPTLGRVAGVSALESGASALGYSDESLMSQKGAGQVAAGTTVGTAAGVVLDQAGGRLGRLGRGLVEFVRKRFGDRADTAVQAELNRLAAGSGKSVDEIIEDIAAGRVMADNITLANAIKGYVNEGGAVRGEILGASAQRTLDTTEAATEGLRGALAPRVDDQNTFRGVRESEAQLDAAQRQEYNRVFAQTGDVDAATQDQILSILQRFPAARQPLAEIYQANNIVPLFREVEGGAIEMLRVPTVQDAEILRRKLKDMQSGAFQSSDGSMGEAFGSSEGGLRRSIDEQSPELANIRRDYAIKMDAKEAFELGRKRGLTMNVDELSYMIESFGPEQTQALRAGVMDAINNRARRSGVTVRDLANEDRQIGAALRAVLPEGSEDVLRSVGRAAEVGEVNRIIQPQAGSPTQALQVEAQQRGASPSMEDVARGMGGDVMSLARIVSKFIPSAKGMSQDQMVQVARVLFSEDPEFVSRAMKDKTLQGDLLRRAEQVAKTIVGAARIPAEQQAVQATQESL